jgi:hypothetical protein
MKISIIPIAIICCISCNSGVTRPKRTDSTAVPKHDSIILPPSYLTFRNFFEKDKNGNIDPVVVIPIPLINSFLTDTIDRQFNNSVNPMEWVDNRYGDFFMIRVRCTSGGECATYQLLAFDKSGRFVKSKELGQLAAEENSATYFSYKILSDTMLKVTSTNYENDAATDSTSEIIRLSLH